MHFKNTPPTFFDSQQHGAGCELFIVEGESAGNAVVALRDSRFQAVLPLQGKPLNAVRAGAQRARVFPFFAALQDALGVPGGLADDAAIEAPALRFERTLLLFDPDADGIHIGALMQMYFHTCLRPLLRAGAVWAVQPPWLQFDLSGSTEPLFAYSHSQALHMAQQLRAAATPFTTLRPRGLAGIEMATLRRRCVDPATRLVRVLTEADARMAMNVFAVDV